jgi:hypothetical protein
VVQPSKATAIGGESPTNGAAEEIGFEEPYFVTVTVRGTSAIIFHAWNNEAVAEKSAARKNSKAKKTDNVESFVYRTPEGEIAIPGTYLKGSLCDPQKGAAKFLQDPRSPRKSALDLFKAGVIVTTEYASLGKTEWDYVDQRRVVIQRSAITRSRPAFLAGWEATFEVMVQTPEYIDRDMLHAVIANAGRLVGLGDFRPTYGRFQVIKFEG